MTIKIMTLPCIGVQWEKGNRMFRSLLSHPRRIKGLHVREDFHHLGIRVATLPNLVQHPCGMQFSFWWNTIHKLANATAEMSSTGRREKVPAL